MEFQRQPPHPQLRHLIQGFWMISNRNAELLHLIPDGYPEIYMVVRGGFAERQAKIGFIGQFSRRFPIQLLPDTCIFSVKLYPWVPAAFFGPIAEITIDQFTELELLDGGKPFALALEQCAGASTFSEMAGQFEQIVFRKLLSPERGNPYLSWVVGSIFQGHGTAPFSTFTERIHASRRHLEKTFKSHIGLSLKSYCRLIRIKKASIELLEDRSGQTIRDTALKLGYYDSSHFRKDFKRVVGKTPGQFILEQRPDLELTDSYLRQWDYS